MRLAVYLKLARRRTKPCVKAFGLELSRLYIVSQAYIEYVRLDMLLQPGIVNRGDKLDAAVKVSKHPVCAADINILIAAVGEIEDTAVLKKAPDNADDFYRLGKPRHARPERTIEWLRVDDAGSAGADRALWGQPAAVLRVQHRGVLAFGPGGGTAKRHVGGRRTDSQGRCRTVPDDQRGHLAAHDRARRQRDRDGGAGGAAVTLALEHRGAKPALVALCVVLSVGWTSRTAGLVYGLRYQAFRQANDWAFMTGVDLAQLSPQARLVIERLRRQMVMMEVPPPNLVQSRTLEQWIDQSQ